MSRRRRPTPRPLARDTALLLAARLEAAATLLRLAKALETGELDAPPRLHDRLVGGAIALGEMDNYRETDV